MCIVSIYNSKTNQIDNIEFVPAGLFFRITLALPKPAPVERLRHFLSFPKLHFLTALEEGTLHLQSAPLFRFLPVGTVRFFKGELRGSDASSLLDLFGGGRGGVHPQFQDVSKGTAVLLPFGRLPLR